MNKTLLITHCDLDGISPIILLNLTGINFEYKSIEINEVTNTFENYVFNNYKDYENIYVCDLTIPEDVYQKINELGIKNLKVFDHHATHLYATKYDYATVITHYGDIQTCATEVFFNYLREIYKNLNTPIIEDYVKQVRELDTFTFTSDLPNQIDLIKVGLGKVDFIKSITKRLKKDKEQFTLTAFEKRFVKMERANVDRYLIKKNENLFEYEINGYKCGIVFAENNKTDLGNYLAVEHPDLDLIAIIDASKSISYRARKDSNADVSLFAGLYGGGGHPKASGSPFNDLKREEIILSYFKDAKKIEKEENSNIG